MMKNDNDHVRTASYIFLNEYKGRTGRDATGVLYNKYLTLLHRDLKKEGIDIRLSHCWYRWGDAVVQYYLPYIHWTHDDLDKTTVSFVGRPRYDHDDPVVIRSKEFAKEFIDSYGNGTEGVESAIDEVYSEAPFEFQNEYRKLRESLRISKSRNPYENFKDYALSLLKNAMDVFPKEFSVISRQKDEFVAVFEGAVRNNTPEEVLFDMAEDFWFFFCYYLRINKKCHENVTNETLRIWRSVIPSEKERFERSIQNYAHQFCDGDDNAIVQGMLRRRTERLSELKQLLSDIE